MSEEQVGNKSYTRKKKKPDGIQFIPISLRTFKLDGSDGNQILPGSELYCTVILRGVATDSVGITVHIETSPSSVLDIPTSVVVPQDSISKTFKIKTLSTVTTSQEVTIKAYVGGTSCVSTNCKQVTVSACIANPCPPAPTLSADPCFP
jgi:hypothetical protein